MVGMHAGIWCRTIRKRLQTCVSHNDCQGMMCLMLLIAMDNGKLCSPRKSVLMQAIVCSTGDDGDAVIALEAVLSRDVPDKTLQRLPFPIFRELESVVEYIQLYC